MKTKERKHISVEYKLLRDLRKEVNNLNVTLLNFTSEVERLGLKVYRIESHISISPKKKFKLKN